MKVMSRDFTRIEKLIIVALILVLLGLFYFRFVDKLVRDTIASAEADAAEYQTELDKVQAEVARLQTIQDSMDDMEAQGELTWMSSYNNSQDEVAFLNVILADTLQYSISFANVTRSGDQIRRSFTLQYRTKDYKDAETILRRLREGHNRCVVSDVACSISSRNGAVTMSQSATFYETMVGGVPDAALPQDSAAVNS